MATFTKLALFQGPTLHFKPANPLAYALVYALLGSSWQVSARG
jgi:hypothetical protein